MRKVILIVTALLLIGLTACEKPISENIVKPEQTEKPRTSALKYTLEDVKTLKTKPLTMDVKRLDPKDWTTDIKIEKWSGENLVIAVPNSNPTAEAGLAKRYNRITLLDGSGIVAQYDTGKHDVTDITLFPNYMLVKTRVKIDGVNVPGIAELDYSGKCLWGLEIDKLSHSVEMLPNGNYLIMRGDYDQAIEMTREGKIAWEWNAMEGIPQYAKENFTAFADRTEPAFNVYNEFRMATPNGEIWTHANAVQKLDDGYLISLRNLNLVVKVGFDKKIKWTVGALLIKYQHRPRLLENGNILIYDNGNGRVVEFTPLGDVVFEYPIYSAVWGSVDKLSNGNYIFPSCFEGVILEVSPNKEIVKKVVMGKMPLIRVHPKEALEWIGGEDITLNGLLPKDVQQALEQREK